MILQRLVNQYQVILHVEVLERFEIEDLYKIKFFKFYLRNGISAVMAATVSHCSFP